MVWMLRYNNGTVTSDSLLLQKNILISSFGIDQNNELYVVQTAAAGKIYRFNKSPLAGIVNQGTNTPDKFSLEQNYPNPFNPETKISYSIANSSAVSLKVYDVDGKEVANLVNESQAAGNYSVSLNASKYSLASGVYYAVLNVSGTKETIKMLLTK
jgi:hypothetical protein